MKSRGQNSVEINSLPTVAQLSQLVNVMLDVEDALGGPQDIEWTMKRGLVYVLQARPITTTKPEPPLLRSRPAPATLDSMSAVYRAFRVPPNLQLHLLRVAAVAAAICHNWKGPAIDTGSILAACLLHDIGNIVKADYDRFPDLFPEEMKNLGYWKAVQEEVRQKHGQDDLEATVAMAEAIGADRKIVDLIRAKQFVKNRDIAASQNWESKIAAYSDQRVGPHGVLPLEERFSEARRRYRGVQYASVNRPDYDVLTQSAYDIESQISGNCAIRLADISDESIEPMLAELRSIDLRDIGKYQVFDSAKS